MKQRIKKEAEDEEEQYDHLEDSLEGSKKKKKKKKRNKEDKENFLEVEDHGTEDSKGKRKSLITPKKKLFTPSATPEIFDEVRA